MSVKITHHVSDKEDPICNTFVIESLLREWNMLSCASFSTPFSWQSSDARPHDNMLTFPVIMNYELILWSCTCVSLQQEPMLPSLAEEACVWMLTSNESRSDYERQKVSAQQCNMDHVYRCLFRRCE